MARLPASGWAQSIASTLPLDGSRTAVIPVTHQIYVVDSSGIFTPIDGTTASTTTQQVGGSGAAVAVNEVTNQARVANVSGNSVEVGEP